MTNQLPSSCHQTRKQLVEEKLKERLLEKPCINTAMGSELDEIFILNGKQHDFSLVSFSLFVTDFG